MNAQLGKTISFDVSMPICRHMAELLCSYNNSSYWRRHPDPWMGNQSDWVDVWYYHHFCVSLQHLLSAHKAMLSVVLKL